MYKRIFHSAILIIAFTFTTGVHAATPIGAYLLDGNANDESGNLNNGSIQGTPTPVADRFGNPDSALQFDGIDDFIELPITSGSIGESFTLSSWIYRTKSFNGNGKMGVVSSDRINIRGVFFGINANEAAQAQVLLTSASVSGPFIPASTWTHIAITFEAEGLLTLYVNGSAFAVTSAGGPGVGSTYFIARDPYNFTPATRNFGGRIDDVCIFNEALTATEIFDLYSGTGCQTDLDEDNDGVLDVDDSCLGTSPGIVVDTTGCSIEQICPCDGFKNHGQRQSCVTRTVKDFVTNGLLSKEEGHIVKSDSAQSSCGKP